MRYLLVIFILVLFFYSEKGKKRAVSDDVQAVHEYWENNLASVRQNTAGNCFELPENNDLDVQLAVLTELSSATHPYFTRVEKVISSGSEIFLHTLTFLLTDLPPPTVS